MTKRKRRALIKILAETSSYEEGSLVRTPHHDDLAEARERIRGIGGEWVARHRGRLGNDGLCLLPRSRR